MYLEARSRDCFSPVYVLKRDGQPVGEYRGRWFNEGVDVHLIGRRKLHLQKDGFFGSRFTFTDATGSALLGSAARRGWLSTTWDLQLSGGPAELVSKGWLNTAYEVRQHGQIVGEVNRIGFCEGGWSVRGSNPLLVTDLLLVGLIYHTILQRRKSSD